VSASIQRAGEEAVAVSEPELDPMRQCAQRAKSLTPTAPLPFPPGVSVTDSDPAARARDAVLRLAATRAWLLTRIERAKARELNLVNGPPPSIRQMHARHAAAAGHWQGGFPKGCRLAWGWLHTAVFTLVLAALDAAFSPAGAIIAVLFIYALLHWL